MIRPDKRSAGFTVIEIMIVLAIGGLIMFMIFQAIPHLQRNSRNNQRKQDVTQILAGVSHYELNYSGNIPPNAGMLPTLHLSIYQLMPPGNITVSPQSSGGGTLAPLTSTDQVHVYNYYRCSTTTPGGATQNASGYHDVVALYALESSSGSTPQCQEL